MFRVCDADALMIPGSTVYYVVKEDPSKEEFHPIILDESEMISAHRDIAMIIVHNGLDDETNLPILTYVVKDNDKIHYEPKEYNTITLEDLINLLEYDDEFTIIETSKPGLVSAISICYDRAINKNIVHIETADIIIQPAPFCH